MAEEKREPLPQRAREHQRNIKMARATIERNDTPSTHQEYLRKRIAKSQKYLRERGFPEA